MREDDINLGYVVDRMILKHVF